MINYDTIQAALATRTWVRNQEKRKARALTADEVQGYVEKHFGFLKPVDRNYAVEMSQIPRKFEL